MKNKERKKMTFGEINNKLWKAHRAEGEKKKINWYNTGYSQVRYAILSKTSRGYFETRINPSTKKIKHTWEFPQNTYPKWDKERKK